jgi:hypothetical protein
MVNLVTLCLAFAIGAIGTQANGATNDDGGPATVRYRTNLRS